MSALALFIAACNRVWRSHSTTAWKIGILLAALALARAAAIVMGGVA